MTNGQNDTEHGKSRKKQDGYRHKKTTGGKKLQKSMRIPVALSAACVLLLLAAGTAAGVAMSGTKADEAVNSAESDLQLSLEEELRETETEGDDAGNGSDSSQGQTGSGLTDRETAFHAQDPEKPDEWQGNMINLSAPQQTEQPQQTAAQQAASPVAEETAMLTHGIDVAKYQGIINWKEVRQAGMDFAMIRAGYRTSGTGVLCEDAQARYNMQEAQAAGLKVGVYFFSTALNEAEAVEEAAWLTQFIARYRITYPVVYNCENFKSQDSRQYMLSKEQRTKNAVAFLEKIREAGYTPMFYANKSEMADSMDWDMTQLSRYKIWTAYYPDVTYPQLASSGYPGEAMWQYTNRGKVPGVEYDVDLNVAYFGYEQEAQAKDNTPPEVVAANVEAHITFQEVNETVTAKVKTNVRSVPSSDSPDTVLAQIVNGDVVTRTGIGSNGWSRIIYQGRTCYAVSEYLTTEMDYQNSIKPTADHPDGNAVFTEANEKVTAKSVTNLRSFPSTESDETIVTTINRGDIVTRIGVGSNGWSKVLYNNQVLYAVSSYLMPA